tara:strand:+ start:1482 stop:1664 length:183 start_codon:yes stop_codon:yes gene_type:complete
MSLEGHYEYSFGMIQHHHWNLTEIENMIPWERDIYTNMLIRHLEEEQQRQRDQDQKMKHR